MNVIDEVILFINKQLHILSPLERTLIDTTQSWDKEDENEIEACLRHLDLAKEVSTNNVNMEELHGNLNTGEPSGIKLLPSHSKYVFLEKR